MPTTIALFALFLVALAVIGFAAVRIFTTRDAEGRRQPLGCISGCCVGFALAALGLAGLGALILSLLANGVADGFESLSLRSVTLVRNDGPDDPEVRPFHDPRRALHVIFEIEGAEAPTEHLVRVLEEWFKGEARIEVTRTRRDEEGNGVDSTLVDVAISASRHELRELERNLRDFVLPELDLDEGLRVRMETRRED